MKLQPHVPVDGICMYLSHFRMLSTNSDSQEHHGVNPEFHPQQWFHSQGHILTGFSSMPLVRQWDSENGWFYATCHVYNTALHVPFFTAQALGMGVVWRGASWPPRRGIGKVKALVAGSLCYICVCTCCMFIAYIVHSWFTLVIAWFVFKHAVRLLNRKNWTPQPQAGSRGARTPLKSASAPLVATVRPETGPCHGRVHPHSCQGVLGGVVGYPRIAMKLAVFESVFI